MIDQDGVVIDENYRITSNISELINLIAKNPETKIVPNTDTPTRRIIMNFKNLVGFKPNIIIAEKGAVVEVQGKKKYTANITGINRYCLKLKTIFEREGAKVIIDDSATWIQKNKKFTPNKNLLIIDALREQTIAFYLKVTDKTGLSFSNKEWSKKGLELAGSIPLPKGLEPFNYSPSYGIAVSNVKGISKSDGYFVIRKLYPKAKFFMIGDSDADIITDRKVIHCAVGNASSNLKLKSQFVAERSITEGLRECLHWIIKK